jgi:NAD(P)-dependent dehydrogenase (short-subunit alcohol dehydrogenase family)
MRVYLACTVRGERSGVLAGRAICQRLQQLGHEILTTHLLTEDVDRAEAELTEEQVYRRDLDWLSCCDVLVTATLAGTPERFASLTMDVSAESQDSELARKLITIAGRACQVVNTLAQVAPIVITYQGSPIELNEAVAVGSGLPHKIGE